jgi:hypothetical protein
MPPVGFEPTISAGERPQIYALDRAATRTGVYYRYCQSFIFYLLPAEFINVLCKGLEN